MLVLVDVAHLHGRRRQLQVPHDVHLDALTFSETVVLWGGPGRDMDELIEAACRGSDLRPGQAWRLRTQRKTGRQQLPRSQDADKGRSSIWESSSPHPDSPRIRVQRDLPGGHRHSQPRSLDPIRAIVPQSSTQCSIPLTYARCLNKPAPVPHLRQPGASTTCITMATHTCDS